MTPNGGIIFGLLVIGATLASGSICGLAVLFALCLGFGAIELNVRMMKALAWAAGIVLPLAAFMVLTWIAIVGRSPAEIAAGVPGTRMAAFVHVVTICLRLFVIAFVIQLIVSRFAELTPLQFIRRMTAPIIMKKLLVMTLSWVDTMLHAVDRSRTALVAAGIIAPRLAWKNIANGWILVQTVWLSVTTIAIGRVRDKWPAENTPARLDSVFSDVMRPPFTIGDWSWIAVAAAAVVVAVKVG